MLVFDVICGSGSAFTLCVVAVVGACSGILRVLKMFVICLRPSLVLLLTEQPTIGGDFRFSSVIRSSVTSHHILQLCASSSITADLVVEAETIYLLYGGSC